MGAVGLGEVKEGWYPNPDGAANERRWDGAAWTGDIRDYSPPGARTEPASTKVIKTKSSPSAWTTALTKFMKGLPRWSWGVIAGGLALAVVLAVGIPLAVSNAKDGADTPAVQSSKSPADTTPEPVAPKSTPAPVGPTIVPMGSPIVSPNYSLIIDSVEILDQIEATREGPIVAEPGTQLVLVHSTITITGNAQDLTCGSDLFMQAYDSNGSKMAAIFEGPRIPGNPQCNHKTSAGETVAWNFAYKIASGRTPRLVAVIDTNVDGNYTWGEEVIASLG